MIIVWRRSTGLLAGLRAAAVLAVVICALPARASVGTGRVRLPGHLPEAAIARSIDAGAAPAAEAVKVVFALPLRNQDALDDLLRRLYNPADPLYGRYLTTAQFTERFGPTQADCSAVMAFARASGLRVVQVNPMRTLIGVEGSAAAVGRAFGVGLRLRRAPDGRVFRTPDSDPSLPAAVANRVSAVVGLDSALRLHTHIRSVRPAGDQAGIRAAADPRQTGSGPGGALTPNDLRTAFGLGGVTLPGSGQTLAVFELDGYTASDISAYTTYYSLPAVTLQNVLVDGATATPSATDGPIEVTLDIELQAAIARNASKIMVYIGPNTGTGILHTYSQIASDNLAKQISTSWGYPELEQSTAFINAEAPLFQQMAAQGQTIYAAAGDHGAYDNYPIYGGSATLSVDDPASQPYMCGVGGTKLKTNGAGGAYVSETVWNAGSAANGAGGGGISARWTIPSYQVGVITSPSFGSNSMRNVPDVAMMGDPSTGYSVRYAGGWYIVGGTSAGSPVWAGFTALVNQARTGLGLSTLGFANAAFYPIGAGASYTTNFHDIADSSTNLYYPAVTGYDCATGWGSFKGAALLATLAPAVVPTTLTVQSLSGAVRGAVSLKGTLTRTSGGTAVNGETLAFSVGGTSVGSATTGADGAATLSYTIPDGAGTGGRTISVDHAATAGFAASNGTGTLTVTAGATALALDAAYGDRSGTASLRAHLTCAAAAVAGRTVAFTVDGVSAGSATTDAGGLASVSYSIAAAAVLGAHAVGAVFDATADTTFTGATAAPGTLTVRTPTAFSLYAASGAPGAAVTLKALMMGGGVPVVGRTVAFAVDGSAAGTGVTDAAGVASRAYTIPLAMSLGTHSVTAAFDAAADTTYASTSRTTAVLTVALPKANVAFSQYAANGSPGDRVTLRTLMLSGGVPVIGRLVQFSVDGTLVGSATSDATGASLAWTIPAGLAVGTHNVGVSFAGDASYNAASRTTAVLTVLSARANVGFSPYAASGAPGAVVTLRTLMLSAGVAVVGRTVQFAVDGVSAGSATSDASGASRTWTIPAGMSLGLHNLTVSFAGDTSYNAATRTVACVTVVVAKANVAFSPYAASGSVGQQVLLRALVISGGVAAVGLTIDVAVDGTAAGSAVSDASGVSLAYTIPVSAALGLHNVTFSFAGDATHNAALRTSAVLTVK